MDSDNTDDTSMYAAYRKSAQIYRRTKHNGKKIQQRNIRNDSLMSSTRCSRCYSVDDSIMASTRCSRCYSVDDSRMSSTRCSRCYSDMSQPSSGAVHNKRNTKECKHNNASNFDDARHTTTASSLTSPFLKQFACVQADSLSVHNVNSDGQEISSQRSLSSRPSRRSLSTTSPVRSSCPSRRSLSTTSPVRSFCVRHHALNSETPNSSSLLTHHLKKQDNTLVCSSKFREPAVGCNGDTFSKDCRKRSQRSNYKKCDDEEGHKLLANSARCHKNTTKVSFRLNSIWSSKNLSYYV